MQLYFDDVDIGQQWTSAGRTITEADIVNFAGLSGDFNPIHVDREYAKNTPYAQPIAHGLLVWSVSTGLVIHAPPMRTMAFLNIQQWHFKEAVFAGDTIHVRAEILEKEERGKGRRGIITWRRQILNQSDVIVQEGITQTLVQGRGKK